MPTAAASGVMRDFRAAPRAVMSNARCLTEGVDVPAVDMVAFLSPRRSRVDIVQATGRAMRQAPGKTTGLRARAALRRTGRRRNRRASVTRTDFDEVWDVLQALQEQDEVLAEIIRQMREQRGRTKGFDDARFRERVEILGPRISLEKLRRAISTSCIEALMDDWEECFGELQAFKNEHGHSNVPNGWIVRPTLARWVALQRQMKRHGRLRHDRMRRLELLGFIWKPREESWEKMFSYLLEYKKEHGDCNVPRHWTENAELAAWVGAQRQMRTKNKLTEDRIVRMEQVGFVWDPHGCDWEKMFSALLSLQASTRSLRCAPRLAS